MSKIFTFIASAVVLMAMGLLACTSNHADADVSPHVTGSIVDADHVERTITVRSDEGNTVRIIVREADIVQLIRANEITTSHLALERGARVRVWLQLDAAAVDRAEQDASLRAERIAILERSLDE